VIVLALMFIIANIAIAYLPTNMIGSLFWAIYTIMFWVTMVMLPLWVMWIFTGIFRDKEVKRMLERGVDMKSSL
jgi:energy-converting hydrogenase Eha subunit C